MSNVRNINAARADRANDNRLLSPVECLEDALNEVREGKRACDKVLVLTLDTTDDCFSPGWYAANLRSSEMIALMEAVKAQLLTDMGFTS